MDVSIVRHLDQQQRVLKLSEAIRIGARLRPQCKVRLFSDGKSCALGAAYEGATGKTCGYRDYSLVKMQFPQLLSKIGEWRIPLYQEVYTRNDSGQTREQIADWLESIGY